MNDLRLRILHIVELRRKHAAHTPLSEAEMRLVEEGIPAELEQIAADTRDALRELRTDIRDLRGEMRDLERGLGRATKAVRAVPAPSLHPLPNRRQGPRN